MEALLNLLGGNLGKEVVAGIAKNTNASTEETSAVVSNALPALLAALQRNAGSENGAQGILHALHTKHDGSMLDNLSGFIGSGDTADGNGILKHVLGDKRQLLEQAVSGKTGVSSGTVSNILAMLAPVVMGYLGKQGRSRNVNDSNGLNDMLGNLLGGNTGGNILNNLLDQNGDGKLGMDDVGGLLGGFFGKK